MTTCPCGAYIADPDLADVDIWEYCKCGHDLEEHEDSATARCLMVVRP